jgi:fatty acid desaturase
MKLLCFFPLFGSMTTYRAKHLPHHLYPNQERDPNMGNGKAERLYAKFPMPKMSFIYHYYLKFFWPPFILANLLDLLDVLAIGSGMSPVPVSDKPNPKGGSKLLRVKATILGIVYLGILIAVIHTTKNTPVFWLAIGGTWLAAVVVWAFLPDSAFFSAARLNFRHKTSGLLRLTFYTLVFSGLEQVRRETGIDLTWAYLILWVFPLIYVFPYLMLLREICQHANAGTGQLDNSRITHTDPFSRWAVFGYGNDFHLVHHIYPNVPHYHLRGTHDQLCDESTDYRDGVEVTYGTLSPPKSVKGERMSLLDSLASDAPMPHNDPAAEKRET